VPVEKVSINIHRYGNMSAAIAQVKELEEGRVEAGSIILKPGSGRGLIWCAQLLKCGKRITPLATSDAELPPNDIPYRKWYRKSDDVRT
jgi:3-oxoacyl-[acyl-carrier-protein] synthase III